MLLPHTMDSGKINKMNTKLSNEIVHAELTRDARNKLKLLAVLEGKTAKQYLIDLIEEKDAKRLKSVKGGAK